MNVPRLASCSVAAAVLLAGQLTVAAPASGVATWLSPTDVSVAAGLGDPDPRVVVSPRGDATAAWLADVGPDVRVMTARRPAGGDWTRPRAASEPGTHADGFGLAIDGAGRVTLAWTASDPTGSNRLETRRHGASGPWQDPVTVATIEEPAQYEGSPALAADSRGDLIVAWLGRESGVTFVAAAYRRSGASWSSATTLSTPGLLVFSPDVAIDPAGHAYVAWQGTDGSSYRAQVARRRASGGWTGPALLSAAGQDAQPPRITVDAAGAATAIWARGTAIESARRPAGGSWSVSRVAGSLVDPGFPQLAVDRLGTVTAVWTSWDGAKEQVQATVRRPGAGWSVPVSLPATGDDIFQAPGLAVDRRGNAVVGWTRQNSGGGYQPRLSYRPRGGFWTPSVSPVVSAGTPHPAFDGDGNATAVWWNAGGTGIIQSAVLDVAGPHTRITRPTHRFVDRRSFRVGWSARDTWSGIAGTTVRYRSGRRDGRLGTWHVWQRDTTATHARFRGRFGRRYCFAARSRDLQGNVGGWSKQRCVVVRVP